MTKNRNLVIRRHEIAAFGDTIGRSFRHLDTVEGGEVNHRLIDGLAILYSNRTPDEIVGCLSIKLITSSF